MFGLMLWKQCIFLFISGTNYIIYDSSIPNTNKLLNIVQYLSIIKHNCITHFSGSMFVFLKHFLFLYSLWLSLRWKKLCIAYETCDVLYLLPIFNIWGINLENQCHSSFLSLLGTKPIISFHQNESLSQTETKNTLWIFDNTGLNNISNGIEYKLLSCDLSILG